MMFNKEELTKVTGAELLKDSGKSLNYNISTDTRTIKCGGRSLSVNS